MTPFLSFYVPTFKLANGLAARPGALARCLESVAIQSEPCQAELIEDAVLGGSGVGGMYTQVPANAHRMRGEYVHVLADDDELINADVVAKVKAFAIAQNAPDVILVNSWKQFEQGWLKLPLNWDGVPVKGWVDLGCIITRRDVWQQHAHAYGSEYEGDHSFLSAVHAAGHRIARFDLDFVRGAVMRGAAE